MSDFPRERAKILELVQHFISGMSEPTHVSAFTNSPVTVAQLNTAIDGTATTLNARQLAQFALDNAITDDQEAIDVLIALMQQIISFAREKEKTVPEILHWLNYQESEPNLLPPGMCRHFELVKRTPGLLHLDWKGPKFGTDISEGEGGRAKYYEVVWRENPTQDWKVVSIALLSEAQISLAQWTTGTTFEISVRGVNKQDAGIVAPSITIVV